MAGLHTLKRTEKRPAARVGRGGRRGKTSGRGTKGQNARAGSRPRPELRDIIKKLPKKRGYGKNRARGVYADRPQPTLVTLRALEEAFGAGESVTLASLVERNLIKDSGRRKPMVKIVATGELSKKLAVEGCQVSEGAKSAIEKAGGSIQ